jgi:hypothetical protein
LRYRTTSPNAAINATSRINERGSGVGVIDAEILTAQVVQAGSIPPVTAKLAPVVSELGKGI